MPWTNPSSVTVGQTIVALWGNTVVEDLKYLKNVLDGAESQNVTFAGNLTLSGSARRIRGDFSTSTTANRVHFQTSTTNGATIIGAIPDGTSTSAAFRAINNSTPTNSSYIGLVASSTTVSIESSRHGSGSFLPLTIIVNGAERARFHTSGGVSIGTTTDPGADNLIVDGRARINDGLHIPSGSGFENSQGAWFAWNMRESGDGQTEFINHRGGGGGGFTWWNTANMSSFTKLADLDANGILRLGTDQLAAHRHPFSNQRHIEVGRQAFSHSGSPVDQSVGFTFTNAFAGTPVVIAGWERNEGVPGNNTEVDPFVQAVTTTGFTWSLRSGSSASGWAVWHAEGGD